MIARIDAEQSSRELRNATSRYLLILLLCSSMRGAGAIAATGDGFRLRAVGTVVWMRGTVRNSGLGLILTLRHYQTNMNR